MRLALKAIKGRGWDKKLNSWVYSATPASAHRIERALAGIAVEINGDTTFLRMLDQYTDLVECMKNEAPQAVPNEKTPSFMHQRKGFWLMAAAFGDNLDNLDNLDGPSGGGGFYLAHDMGVGKSKIVVDYVVNFGLKRVLIVCPKSVIEEWPIQFEKHAKKKVRCLALSKYSVAKRAKLVQEALKKKSPLVVVINFDSVWRSKFSPIVEDNHWDMIVADEIHRIMHGTTKVSKFFGQISGQTERRVGMSGTPMPNEPINLFGQMRFVDPGLFGTSFISFRSRYAIMGGFQNHEVVAYKNLDELHSKFYTLAHRVEKKDALDLPPFVDEERTVTLGKEALRVYEDIETSFKARLLQGDITVANALVELIRLQQLTGGVASLDATSDQPKKLIEIDKGKANALKEVFGDLSRSEPVVVFCKYRHDLDTVHKMAKASSRGSAELSGRVHELNKWRNAGDDITVFAVQVASGGLGIDLTRSCYCVYYSLGFQPGEYEQTRARLHRQGQTRSVTYIHLIAKRETGETIDERIYKALKRKGNVIKSVLDDYRKGS